MSEETQAKKPLKLNRPGKLELKKTVETGQVRQSFSHGRSKAVVVEVKRSKTFERGASGRMAEVTKAEAAEQQAAEEAARTEAAAGLGADVSHLSAKERASRLRALEISREEESLRKQEEALREQLEAEAAARQAEEEARKQAEEEERRKQEADGAVAEIGRGNV